MKRILLTGMLSVHAVCLCHLFISGLEDNSLNIKAIRILLPHKIGGSKMFNWLMLSILSSSPDF